MQNKNFLKVREKFDNVISVLFRVKVYLFILICNISLICIGFIQEYILNLIIGLLLKVIDLTITI